LARGEGRQRGRIPAVLGVLAVLGARGGGGERDHGRAGEGGGQDAAAAGERCGHGDSSSSRRVRPTRRAGGGRISSPLSHPLQKGGGPTVAERRRGRKGVRRSRGDAWTPRRHRPYAKGRRKQARR